jgi:hypothetical protein
VKAIAVSDGGARKAPAADTPDLHAEETAARKPDRQFMPTYLAFY